MIPTTTEDASESWITMTFLPFNSKFTDIRKKDLTRVGQGQSGSNIQSQKWAQRCTHSDPGLTNVDGVSTGEMEHKYANLWASRILPCSTLSLNKWGLSVGAHFCRHQGCSSDGRGERKQEGSPTQKKRNRQYTNEFGNFPLTKYIYFLQNNFRTLYAIVLK